MGIFLKLVFSKANKFKDFTDALVKIVDEAPIVVDESGFSSRSLSEDKTTMAILHIPSESFESIEIEEKTLFKIKSKELNRVLKRASKNDSLEMEIDKARKVLKILFSDVKKGIQRNFEVPISFEGVEELKEPEVALPVDFVINGGDFKDIVDDIKYVSDEVKIEYKENALHFSAESQGRSYSAILKEGEPLISLRAPDEPVVSKYSINLLNAAVRGIDTGNTISVSFGNSLPMKIYTEVSTIGTLAFWIAPRV